MKRGKHAKKEEKELLQFDEFQKEEEPEIQYEEEEEEEELLKKVKIPKAVYRIGVILVVVILGLILWMNRGNLAPDRVISWFKLQLMGSGSGDGFPVQITGTDVREGNFTQHDGAAAVLSDTSFSLINSTGRSLISLQHGFNDPVLCASGGNYLLYNLGSTGYLLQSGTDTVVNKNAPADILAGAVCRSGRFALGMQGSEGASLLEVYLKDGTLQYSYRFARDYITALALNSDGTYGAVCTVRSENGELVSKITAFSFQDTEPIAEYESRDNLLLGIYWGDNGNLYAVGDSAVVSTDSASFQFVQYSYDGRSLASFALAENRAFVSISAYEHAGSSTILVFNGQREPLKIESRQRAKSLSVSGASVASLEGTEVVFYDYTTGTEQSRASAGSDARSVALLSESRAYVLGISEIRMAQAS